jgi:hypothetical protein
MRASILLSFAVIVGVAELASADSYRRWLAPKTFTCSHGPSSATASIDNQNVEFADLPAGAQYTINYIDNGVTTTNGPYTVEKTSGTQAYAPFGEFFDAYPFTFEYRLDTIVNGQVVYRSSITIACASDDSGAATIVNATGPLPTTTTTTTSTTTTTTSSTTLPPGCAEDASLASLDCRLGVFSDEIAVSTLDQALRETLLAGVMAARDAVGQAAGASSTGARKRAIRRADKALAKIAKKLKRAGAAADPTRAAFLRAIAGLRSDLSVLRSG